MNRRHFTQLVGASGAAALVQASLALPRDATEDEARNKLPGAIPLKLGQLTTINASSTPAVAHGNEFTVLSIGKGTFTLSDDHHLTAVIQAAVVQWAEMTYRISIAIFDRQHRLLGAATHDEMVQYVRLGLTPTTFRNIPFDFGVSKTYRKARFVVATISDVDVPKDPAA